MTVRAEGVGGPALLAEGLLAVEDARELQSMGFGEVVARLPRIWKVLRKLTRRAREFAPQVAVVIDYPDFHFRLARALERGGVPLVYYIPPKVWVWRRGRLRVLRKRFSRILGIFPFEEALYARAGAPFVFVGNPLLDELPLTLTRAEARARLGIGTAESQVVLALLPGSRPSEIENHLPVFLEGALLLASQLGRPLLGLLPLADARTAERVRSVVAEWRRQKQEGGLRALELLELRVSAGDSREVLVAADCGWVKSGTATLEAAILGCPHVLVYRVRASSAWLFRHLVRYRGPVGLGNLLAAWDPERPEGYRTAQAPRAVPEVLLEEVTAERLASEALALLTDAAKRASQILSFQRVRAHLSVATGESPSERAAREVLEVALGSRALRPSAALGWARATVRRLVVAAASWLWSAGCALARERIRRGWGRAPERLDARRVVSVGNIQAGGAGKTPLVARIAEEALARGLSVCILARGYKSPVEKSGWVVPPRKLAGAAPWGSKPEEGASRIGDEAALLAEKVPGAWLALGANRAASYRRARAQLGSPFDLVILDDGFQHWGVARDLDVLALSSARWGERLFRDFPSAVHGARLLVWTKGERPPEALRYGGDCVRARVALRVSSRGSLGAGEPGPGGGEANRALTQGSLAGQRLLLVCGVGDPSSVEAAARAAGASEVRLVALPDHSGYDRAALERWQAEASARGLRLATTGKDWVKWKTLGWEPASVLVLEPELVFDESFGGGERLWRETLWGS
jgi:lipid-A-disaccharide synthase